MIGRGQETRASCNKETDGWPCVEQTVMVDRVVEAVNVACDGTVKATAYTTT